MQQIIVLSGTIVGIESFVKQLLFNISVSSHTFSALFSIIDIMNLKLALPSFLVAFAAPVIKADSVDPPNIDQVTYSVNALLGKPPSEQRGHLIGSKMFDFTKTVGRPVNGYNRFPELDEMSNTEHCLYKKEVSENWWGTSSSSLQSQSSTSKHGFERDVDLSVTIPLKGAEVGAETAIRDALGKIFLPASDTRRIYTGSKRVIVFFGNFSL